mgnify:CR=1 FL=1
MHLGSLGFHREATGSHMQPNGPRDTASHILDIHKHAVLPQDLAQDGEITFSNFEEVIIIKDMRPARNCYFEPRLPNSAFEKLVQHQLHPGVHKHGRTLFRLVLVHLGQGEHAVDHSADADHRVVYDNADTGSKGIGDQNVTGILGYLVVGDVYNAIGHRYFVLRSRFSVQRSELKAQSLRV